MYNQIQIIGDYNSSTKYLHNLIDYNFSIKVTSGGLVHKHQYFPLDIPKKYPKTLFFIVYRDFMDWVKSCYRSPHLLATEHGRIKPKNGDINKMFLCKLIYCNEVHYGLPELKEYWKKFNRNYDSFMDYRNKKTEFYLEILKNPNVIALNDKFLRDTNKCRRLITFINKQYKLNTKPLNIPKYARNGSVYNFNQITKKRVDTLLHKKREIELNNKSIKL
jgi:hypothetical protein